MAMLYFMGTEFGGAESGESINKSEANSNNTHTQTHDMNGVDMFL